VADFEVSAGGKAHIIIFSPFLQEPNCNYAWNYTLATRNITGFDDDKPAKSLIASSEGAASTGVAIIADKQVTVKTFDKSFADQYFTVVVIGTLATSTKY